MTLRDGMFLHTAWLLEIKAELHRRPTGYVTIIEGRELRNYLPPFWREEAKTEDEWLTNHCGAHGMHASYTPDRNRFTVTLATGKEAT